MRLAVRVVNILIALLLIVAAAVVYWVAWRPLPKTSGTISTFVSQQVTIARDDLGVPHITAANLDDLLFAQGYAHAQDRLWQMDGLRRYSGGDLAEIVGAAGFESDRESRRLRLRHLADAAYGTMPPADRAAVAAYTRGVNAFIQTHRDNLPVEFTLLQYQPRPWSIIDTILVGLHMVRTLTTTWRDEVAKRAMLNGGDPVKVNFLFAPRTGMEPSPGSNAWAIAGSRTASGRPILSNDMHLEYSIPGIWYMAHLEAPGINVAGLSLPGAPGVLVGHNERIAWGITNLQFDIQDLYIEQFDERTGLYRYQNRVEQARAERELILVKGGAPVEQIVWVTRHGPVFASDGGVRMSLRWAIAETSFQFPLIDLNRARNWQEFCAALARFPGPGSNFVYADVDGNIGYHAAGKLPVRKGWRGDVPVDGASGNYEWQGFIPFEQLPSYYNPPDGLVVTSNQNPFPANYPYEVNGNFAPYYRAHQVRDLLASKKGWRAPELLAVQKDVYSGFSRFLAQSIVAAWDKRHARNPTLAAAIDLLRKWDGQMDKDQAAPMIVALAYQNLRRAAAENASPGKGLAYEFPIATAAIEKLFRERPAGWFSNYDEVLLRVLLDAIEEGRKMQGSDVTRWKYGGFLRLLIAHPIGHRLPFVARYFDIGPVPMSGSSTTVKQTTARLGPSERMNVDLGDFDNSVLNIVTGQSGQVLSSHYRDQWEHYYYGRSYPMQFRKVNTKNRLDLVPVH